MTNKPNALIIGSNGTIGRALVKSLSASHHVFTLSREQTTYGEVELLTLSEKLKVNGFFSVIVCCVGVLHDDIVTPEKSLRSVNAQNLAHYYYVNSILPMLCLKAFVPLLDKHNKSTFICLSAMVGSTTENKLGGWYGYRSSKAALNSLVKTTSIEVRRKNKLASIVAVHPGTTVSSLSKPFANNIKQGQYYTPEQTAERILKIASQLTSAESGDFFNWNGNKILY